MMKVIIFPEEFLFRSLKRRKRALKHMFKIFAAEKRLMIVFLVANIQRFYSRMSEVDMQFKTVCLTISRHRKKNISVDDLDGALSAVAGEAGKTTVISDNAGDGISAKKIGLKFILVDIAAKKISKKNNAANVADLDSLFRLLINN